MEKKQNNPIDLRFFNLEKALKILPSGSILFRVSDWYAFFRNEDEFKKYKHFSQQETGESFHDFIKRLCLKLAEYEAEKFKPEHWSFIIDYVVEMNIPQWARKQ